MGRMRRRATRAPVQPHAARLHRRPRHRRRTSRRCWLRPGARCASASSARATSAARSASSGQGGARDPVLVAQPRVAESRWWPRPGPDPRRPAARGRRVRAGGVPGAALQRHPANRQGPRSSARRQGGDRLQQPVGESRRADGEAARQKGSGVATAEYIPGARVVRAFGTINYKVALDNAHRQGDKIAVPIAGDDAEAVPHRLESGHRRRLRSGDGRRPGALQGLRHGRPGSGRTPPPPSCARS